MKKTLITKATIEHVLEINGAIQLDVTSDTGLVLAVEVNRKGLLQQLSKHQLKKGYAAFPYDCERMLDTLLVNKQLSIVHQILNTDLLCGFSTTVRLDGSENFTLAELSSPVIKEGLLDYRMYVDSVRDELGLNESEVADQ